MVERSMQYPFTKELLLADSTTANAQSQGYVLPLHQRLCQMCEHIHTKCRFFAWVCLQNETNQRHSMLMLILLRLQL